MARGYSNAVGAAQMKGNWFWFRVELWFYFWSLETLWKSTRNKQSKHCIVLLYLKAKICWFV